MFLRFHLLILFYLLPRLILFYLFWRLPNLITAKKRLYSFNFFNCLFSWIFFPSNTRLKNKKSNTKEFTTCLKPDIEFLRNTIFGRVYCKSESERKLEPLKNHSVCMLILKPLSSENKNVFDFASHKFVNEWKFIQSFFFGS